MRFQAYLSIFAGGFGHVYGNEATWDYDPTWKTDLYWDGAIGMKYLSYLFTKGLDKNAFHELKPNSKILANKDQGMTSAECWNGQTLKAPYSSRIIAIASADAQTLLVYSADGSTIQLKKTTLPASFNAYWFDLI